MWFKSFAKLVHVPLWHLYHVTEVLQAVVGTYYDW